MRFRVALASMLILAMTLALPLHAQRRRALTPNEALSILAKRLDKAPNSSKLHITTAKIYFRRGAEGDAARVYRHIKRALEINPGLEAVAQELLTETRPGFSTTPRNNGQMAVDNRIAASLPMLASDGTIEDPDAPIRQGLATRMARQAFTPVSDDYDENTTEVKILFGLEGDEREDDEWNERLACLEQEREGADGWLEDFATALQNAVRRTNDFRRAIDCVEEDVDPLEHDEMSRDPMLLKNVGYLHYMNGDMQRARDCLIGAVAAAQTMEQVMLTKAEDTYCADDEPEYSNVISSSSPRVPRGRSSIGEAFIGGPPSRGQWEPPEQVEPAQEAPAPPPAQDPSPPPPVVEAERETSPTPAAPAPTQVAMATPPEPPAPPPQQPDDEQNREIADNALETLEAMRNEDTPEPEVTRKMAETAGIGTVGEPLVLDLNGNGEPDLVSTWLPDGEFDQTRAVRFDIDGDGTWETVEWLEGNCDGLLAVDLDEDGLITSGAELFGDAHGDSNGFLRLARFDIDGNGLVEGREASNLSVWIDDGDGTCLPGELYALEAVGIEAISCRPQGLEGWARSSEGRISCWEWFPELGP